MIRGCGLRRLAVTLLACAAASLAGCGSSSSSGPGAQGAGSDAAQKEGTVATDFAGRDIDGKTLRLSDYLGKQAVLIDFWATYCQPCLAEMPHLRRIYDQQKTKGFVVIAVSMDGPETVADVPAFAKRNGMVFPVVLDEDSQIASVYNPKKSAPLSILIDKSGKVVKIHEGYNPGDEDALAHEVSMILDQAPQAK